MSLIKLLQDISNTPSGRCRDIQWCLPLLYLGASLKEITQFLEEKLQQETGEAKTRLDQIIKVYTSTRSGMSSTLEELYCLRDGLNEFNKAVELGYKPGMNDPTNVSLQKLVKIELEYRVKKYNELQKNFSKICSEHKPKLDKNCLEIRAHAQRLLIKGFQSSGHERHEVFEQSIKTYKEILEYSRDVSDSLMWLELGWLYWKAQKNLPEAERCFFLACLHRTLNPDLLFVLSARHLAYIQYLQRSYEGAFGTIQKLFKTEIDSITLVEGARYAARTKRIDITENLLKQCIKNQPMSLIKIIADEDFIDATSLLVLLMTEAQKEIRGLALSELNQWNGSVSKLSKIQEQLEEPIELNIDPVSESTAYAQEIGKADFWKAGIILNTVKARHQETLYHIHYHLNLRKESVCTKKEHLDRQMRNVQNAEEAILQRALHRKQYTEHHAKKALNKSIKEQANCQKGCATSFSIGIAAFLFYIGATVTLTLLGVPAGPNSKIGIIFLLLILTPMAITSIMQIVFGLRHYILDSEMTKKMEKAQKHYDLIQKNSEERIKKANAPLEKDGEQVKQKLKQIEQALTSIPKPDPTYVPMNPPEKDESEKSA